MCINVNKPTNLSLTKKSRSGKSKPYQGHRNWNHWNVSLWIGNDEGLYRMAQRHIERYATKDAAAKYMALQLWEDGQHKTPDGAPYTFTTIRAAMVGM